MWGWIGTAVGAAAGGIVAFFTAPVALTAGSIATAVCMIGGGGALGLGLGKTTSFFMDTHKKSLEKQDKKLAVELEGAKTDGERAKAAQQALAHQNTLLNTLNNKVQQNNTEMEEFRKIINGEKDCPSGKTVEEIKVAFAKKEQENAAIFEQIKKSQITSEILQGIIAKPSSFNWPSLTPKNIGWGIGLILGGLILIGIVVRVLKKWLGSLL